ncbi:arginine repressor [Candidatus Epulonipiscium fishelsonii]|uniref:Arginine repressor n=1 Tax=Candidatus Epulonipiscium fishelsonii TaxID=77094 RepID=A0ACC8X7J7_9FIRM|nr:arginine repressor [Epulopiscium sp. SCG-B11WGA-EpuloA1]ONI41384.1 arginine repressor [Epulopiscium sp. SCG-B05WGA-EpuloA1]
MKEKRQTAILNLIDKYEIETQESLVENLENEGFKVTQATISRDIRELKLTKVSTKSNTQKYISLNNYETPLSDKVIRVFKTGYLSMDFANNILVIKTLSGMGNAVASAVDAFNYNEILGTIAGDDTIFCVVRENYQADKISKKFEEVLNS